MENKHQSPQVAHLHNEDVNNLINQFIHHNNELSHQANNLNEDVDMKSLDHSTRSSLSPQSNENSTDQSMHQSKNLCNELSNDPTNDDQHMITSSQLADYLKQSTSYNVLVDTRSFIEYNGCHIQEAINVCCSKIIKRRLQNNKTTVRELLNNVNNGTNLDNASLIVVYDQGSPNVSNLPDDSCLKVLWEKLISAFNNVRFLKGGFTEFHQNFNSLCTNKAQMLQNQKKPTIDAIGQPCMPNVGPTRILPFLYLGSQVDAMNQEVLKNHNITYILNVSTSCPKPDFIKDSHFLRIPVNDNYSDKLLPYFKEAIHFLDKVRESSGCALVHCLGGISRSATVAIAYIMQNMKMTSDDAYRYVKGKRSTISPNFNFLGQLLEYEKQLIDSHVLPPKAESSLLKHTRERQDKGDTDFHLAPSICDLNKSTLSSPKHHVLYHHFKPNLLPSSNQEKKSDSNSATNSSNKTINCTVNSIVDHQMTNPPTDGTASQALCSLMGSSISSTSQFANLNSNLNANQKRTCSFSSSPNNRKMALQSVNENDNLGSIVFMWV